MEITITLTRDGLERIVNKLNGTTHQYKEEIIGGLFSAQEAIIKGIYEK